MKSGRSFSQNMSSSKRSKFYNPFGPTTILPPTLSFSDPSLLRTVHFRNFRRNFSNFVSFRSFTFIDRPLLVIWTIPRTLHFDPRPCILELIRTKLKNNLKWGASSRWSFCPNSAWSSIETTIGMMHPTLLNDTWII